MINILSYIGLSIQSEACLWTLLGLMRTIFDATLFKVNANLKQVWQMQMPLELSLHVQRFVRTMICGLMLVQCFTVYVYLAAYIVLLYPVFLEERPTLVLPWLLLAAIRNLLCELTSLALGLGTCVLLGPARPPCIKFVIIKLVSIMPAFYMWKLIFGYYHFLKVASGFKRFPAVLPSQDLDYGLELAVRRRRTKTLLGEDQVRKKLMASLYCEQTSVNGSKPIMKVDETYKSSSHSSSEDVQSVGDIYTMPMVSTKTISDTDRYEDWFGSEVTVPRDTDRILEQIVLMLLRIGVSLKETNVDAVRFLNSPSRGALPEPSKIECITTEVTETPPLVASSKGRMASYLRDYPQIFMKKPSGLVGQLSPVHESMASSAIVESNQSAHSVETKEVSFESVLLLDENKDIVRSSKKEMSKSSNKNLIHSYEDVTKFEKDAEIENLNIKSKQPKSLKDNSEESVESIINRMKIRAACSELSSTENNNRELGANKTKTSKRNKQTKS